LAEVEIRSLIDMLFDVKVNGVLEDISATIDIQTYWMDPA
jgi:hypothetical protein